MVIERKFIRDKLREYHIKEYLTGLLDRVGFSHIDIQKTPVGFSIMIHSSKPGLIVGRKGLNIREIQETLQKEFKLESPVVEVQEVYQPDLDPQIMAEQIGNQIRRFGVARFKAIGHKATEKMIKSGAIGCEVKIAGLVPSSRARAWKFYAGYLPKCGDVAITKVLRGYKVIKLKRGIVGVTVKILPPGVRMPDQIYMKEVQETVIKADEIKLEKVKKEIEKIEKKEKEVKEKPKKQAVEEAPAEKIEPAAEESEETKAPESESGEE